MTSKYIYTVMKHRTYRNRKRYHNENLKVVKYDGDILKGKDMSDFHPWIFGKRGRWRRIRGKYVI